MKYTLEFKLECIDKYKKEIHVEVPSNCKSSHHDFMHRVLDWTKTYDKFGIDGLKHSAFNRRWTADERFLIVAQTLSGIQPTKRKVYKASIVVFIISLSKDILNQIRFASLSNSLDDNGLSWSGFIPLNNFSNAIFFQNVQFEQEKYSQNVQFMIT